MRMVPRRGPSAMGALLALATLVAISSASASPSVYQPEALFRKRLDFPAERLWRSRENLVTDFLVPRGFSHCTSLDGPSCAAEGSSSGELDRSKSLQHVAELKITEASESDLFDLVLRALAGDSLNAGLSDEDTEAMKEVIAELLEKDEFLESIQGKGAAGKAGKAEDREGSS